MSHWWYKEKVPRLFRVMQSRYYKYAAVSMLLGHLIISSLSRRSLDLPFIPKKILDTRILEQSFCLVLMLISGFTLSPNRNLMNLRVYRWVGVDFINSLLYRSNSRPSRQSLKSMQPNVWNLLKLLHAEGKLPFISDTSTTDTQRAIVQCALVILYPSCSNFWSFSAKVLHYICHGEEKASTPCAKGSFQR